MKAQLFLIGLVAVLSLGALTLADATPMASHSTGVGRPTQDLASPSPEESPDPSDTPDPSDSPESSPSPGSSPSAHPCNHGFYVSQAAHGHHGGAFTSQIARSDLGKNGDCSQPLPSPTG